MFVFVSWTSRAPESVHPADVTAPRHVRHRRAAEPAAASGSFRGAGGAALPREEDALMSGMDACVVQRAADVRCCSSCGVRTAEYRAGPQQETAAAISRGGAWQRSQLLSQARRRDGRTGLIAASLNMDVTTHGGEQPPSHQQMNFSSLKPTKLYSTTAAAPVAEPTIKQALATEPRVTRRSHLLHVATSRQRRHVPLRHYCDSCRSHSARLE